MVDALDLLTSDDPTVRNLGVTHARTIWAEGNEDDDVSRGLRRDCGTDVLAMLDASGVPRTGLDGGP